MRLGIKRWGKKSGSIGALHQTKPIQLLNGQITIVGTRVKKKRMLGEESECRSVPRATGDHRFKTLLSQGRTRPRKIASGGWL